MSQIFRKEKLNNLKKWMKMNKKSKFLNQLLLTWKKIQTDLVFSLAETKFVPSNHGVFKNFAINQSESTFNGHGIFNNFYVNQSNLSSTSHGFFNNFDIVCRYQGFLHR